MLRLHGRNCPEPWPARRSASSQGSKTDDRPQACEHAQSLTARTPWYGEGNSKTAYTRPLHTPAFGKRSTQAHTGRRRQGSAPNGRDLAPSAGCSPRTRRRYAGAHELLLGLLVLLSLQAAPPETVGSVGDVSHYERDALKCLS